MYKVGDLVLVHYTNGQTKKGEIIQVNEDLEYCYVVEVINSDNQVENIHCRKADLEELK